MLLQSDRAYSHLKPHQDNPLYSQAENRARNLPVNQRGDHQVNQVHGHRDSPLLSPPISPAHTRLDNRLYSQVGFHPGEHLILQVFFLAIFSY